MVSRTKRWRFTWRRYRVPAYETFVSRIATANLDSNEEPKIVFPCWFCQRHRDSQFAALMRAIAERNNGTFVGGVISTMFYLCRILWNNFLPRFVNYLFSKITTI